MPNSGKGVLVLYTGGTVGMRQGPQGLVPASVDEVFGQLPASLLSGHNAPTWRSLENPLDSSDLQPEHWQQMAGILAESYDHFEGFVVLHGTDTMAYTASALSFMLQGLAKPVVLTGSQLPLGHRRTDAVHHLNSALEFAMAQKDNGEPRLQEVCLYFHNKVYRGNRCRKNQASGFDAFISPNYPALATAGTALRFDEQAMEQGFPDPINRHLCYRPALDSSIASLRMFPGLNPALVHGLTEKTGVRVLLLEGYGTGNIPPTPALVEALRAFVIQGGRVVALSQCVGGFVDLERYRSGRQLLDLGAIPGRDITFEAALTKSMHLLANPSSASGDPDHDFAERFGHSLVGEISLGSENDANDA